MLQATAKRTADWLVQGGGITEKEREVYEFGLDKLFTMLANFLFVAGIGLFFGMLTQMVIFYASYTMIRIYAGGYHADNPIWCFVMSVGSVAPCLLVIRFQETWNTPVIFFSLLGAAVLLLILLGLVEHKNKLLDALEKIVYRRRLLRNLALVTAGAIALSWVALPAYAAAVLCGILMAAIAAVIGKVKLLL